MEEHFIVIYGTRGSLKVYFINSNLSCTPGILYYILTAVLEEQVASAYDLTDLPSPDAAPEDSTKESPISETLCEGVCTLP